MASLSPARVSILPCPYGCSLSGGAAAARMLTKETRELRTSLALCSASERRLIDPVSSAPTNLRVVCRKLKKSESRAADAARRSRWFGAFSPLCCFSIAEIL